MKIRTPGKHGIGIEVTKGDEFVIPPGFIRFSANPLKGSGNFLRPGLAWFAELVFANSITGIGEDFIPYIDGQLEQFDQFLRRSNIFADVDFDDDANEQLIYDRALANKGTIEWFTFVSANFLMAAKQAIRSNDAMMAARATAVAERYRALWIFMEHFEEAVWMGQSAKRLIDVLSLWDANKTNADEEFWQIKLQEASYVFSQLFSAPITFIQDKAYVGGQQIDGKSSRIVDFLFSGGSSGEAMLIEIKTPMTRLMSKSKYRSSVHAPDTSLSGAVVQAADYRNSIIRDLQTITKDKSIGMSAFNPKVTIIIGNYVSELNTEAKRRSFELYRTSLSNIEIVTFDELFRKIEHLAKLFNLIKVEKSPEQMPR